MGEMIFMIGGESKEVIFFYNIYIFCLVRYFKVWC